MPNRTAGHVLVALLIVLAVIIIALAHGEDHRDKWMVLVAALDHQELVHEVAMDGSWISKHEVTVAQWQAATGNTPEGNDLGQHHPVVYVSWTDRKQFCDNVGLEPPTEAQWEYAARGRQIRRYPCGDGRDE